MTAVVAAFLREYREAVQAIAISAAIGAAIGYGISAQPRGLYQGALAGALMSLLRLLAESALDRLGIAGWPFGLYVAASALATMAAIWGGLLLASLPWLVGVGFPNLRGYVTPFIAALVVSVGFSVWYALSGLLGRDVLVGLLTGRYHRPRPEERIFLFADLVGSTMLAERLGELRYHTFLNRAFVDLAAPVQSHAGSVYQYRGDEMVVTWPLERGSRNGNCFRCARAMLETLEQRAEVYEGEFGAEARVRLALHCGPVVAGEVGGLRREVVYAGDAVNTAARIEAVAKESGHALVASKDVLACAPLPAELEARSLGVRTLRGKGTELELFAIEPGPN